MKTEIYPRAEADIIRQFRYYLVDQDAPAVAFRFREAVIESVEQLKPHPRMGTLFPGSIPGLRSWPVKGLRRSASTTLKFRAVCAWSEFSMASATCGGS